MEILEIRAEMQSKRPFNQMIFFLKMLRISLEALNEVVWFPNKFGVLNRCISFALLDNLVGWKNTVAFGVWQNLSNYFSNTFGLAKEDWILPNVFFFLLWNSSVLQGKFNPYASDLLTLKSSNYCLEVID